MTITNDQIIQAVFTATPENKSRAFDILEGKADPSSDLRPPSSQEAPLLLGMGDSAKFLGISRATLWRMIRDGRLTKVEIYHNAFRLRRSDILALVNERTVGVPPAPSSLRGVGPSGPEADRCPLSSEAPEVCHG